MTEKSLLRIPALYEFHESKLRNTRRIFVVGDLHGDYASFASLLKVVKFKQDVIIFLGDYADRGPDSIRIIRKLHNLINEFPGHVIALKGNHEDYSYTGEPMFLPCDLINDVEKRGMEWYKFFQTELRLFLKKLYLAAIIPGIALFVHGGVSSRISSRNMLRYPSRNVELDVLWSDPLPDSLTGEHENLGRGLGVNFGYDITAKVCKILRVRRIIRSHQPYKASDGPLFMHNKRLITINSSRIYGRPHALVLDRKNLQDFSVIYLD